MATFTATAPNGEIFTRSSEATYTCAAIITMANGDQVAKFSGSVANAEKAARALISRQQFSDWGARSFVVVDATAEG